MEHHQKKEIVSYLQQFITPGRRAIMQQALQFRTHYITLVLENMGQSHNTSAALRSADIFGIQTVQVIEEKRNFKVNSSIARGAQQWLDIKKYNETSTCLKQLKEKGYRLVATMPHANSKHLSHLTLQEPIALLFGAEREGLSATALSYADEWITIPMFGFTQSFNVSVSIALCLYDVISRLHASPLAWSLSEEERVEVLLSWLRKTIPHASFLEQNFCAQRLLASSLLL